MDVKTTASSNQVADAKGRSGAMVGAEHVVSLDAYLHALVAEGRRLPAKGAKVNVSAVALACGFDRAVLYQNPAARELLREAAIEIGLDGEIGERPAEPVDRRDQRILKLEQENANLKAEIFDLRRALRRLEHIEEVMVETGKRVAG
jgi:hypothetical protein